MSLFLCLACLVALRYSQRDPTAILCPETEDVGLQDSSSQMEEDLSKAIVELSRQCGLAPPQLQPTGGLRSCSRHSLRAVAHWSMRENLCGGEGSSLAAGNSWRPALQRMAKFV